MKDWESFGLAPEILRGIYACGFEHPSPIQETAIPKILSGKDIIAQAQSGTGKTGAFCISVLQNCMKSDQHVLILSPTRELAIQTNEVFTRLSQFTNIHSQLLIGGTSIDRDIQDMKKNPKVIIGCPGRIIDFFARDIIHPITMVILDEADEMLSQGFQPQLQTIFKSVTPNAQVVMISATIPATLDDITCKIMRDPEKILVQADMLTLEGISQFYIMFNSDHDKLLALQDLFESISVSQTIIYCNSVKRVCNLYDAMKESGYPVCCIHSEMDKFDRHTAYTEFKNGKYRVLISSNITARGIDIQQVSVVINFDLPKDVHTYLHRIGRSGRWGRKGVGINFITKYDKESLESIEAHYHTQVKEMPNDFSTFI